MDIKNIKKLELTKNKYHKIKIIFIIIIFFIIIINLSLFSYKYIIMNKIWKANVGVEFGNNFKITIYENKHDIPSQYIYYKDGIKKIISANDSNKSSYQLITKDKYYLINDYFKTYLLKTTKDKNITYCPEKMNMFRYYSEILSNEKSTPLSIKSVLFSKVKLKKGEYEGKKYFIFEQGNERMYLNPNTFLVEIILSLPIERGQYTKLQVDINAVTEDLIIPNLENYTEEI